MSRKLFKELEQFKAKNKLSVVALCKQLGMSNTVSYYRWKEAKEITGSSYKKIIEDFLNKSTTSKSADIAVIGIACYYPGASNTRELWENILARRVQFRRMLDQRLPLSEYYDSDPKAPEKTYLTKAAFIENFQFDWGKLRIPKKTVESTDIAHWLALDIALKTFEDAGYKFSEIPLQNTGVIVGNTLTGEQTRSQTLRLRWPYVQKVLNATLANAGIGLEERSRLASDMEKIFKSAFYPITEDSLAGGLANTIAGRICNYLNLKGGGYIVDGACSSSLLAVATACDALKMGNMDLALAGGVDISLDPFELVGFAKAGALAKDKMSVYDQSANGFLPGEGCGFILLKRLEDAVRDKNYIYSVIKGWGISSDGKGGIMEPSSSGQSFAIGRAYKNLKYKIADVDFVEGHGTGTTKGDRVELEGIATAIDQSVSKKNKNLRTCGVTSFKSIVGHTKAAAGIGGLIKAILAVNQRILPPTASCTHPNEVFKDKAKNMYPLIEGGVLSPQKTARAGISSAGFGGINCHVTIESKDAPKEELKSKIDERALFVSQQQTEVFVFTARSIIYLKKIIQKFKEDLRNISIAEMADLAALLNKKVKQRLPIKVAIVTDSPEHLYDALVLLEQEIGSIQIEEGQSYKIKPKDSNTYIVISNGTKKSRIGFLYPGQGSQRLNMTRVLVERFKWAQDLFDLSKLPLYEHIYKATDKFLSIEENEKFEKELADTRVTQPAVVLSYLIWTEFFSRLGIEPTCVAGHSLGELTAFYKAGTFGKEALIKFSELRGQLMAAKGGASGSMVSLFCSKQKAEALLSKISGNIVIANINGPNQVIVSGGNKEIEKIADLAKREGISSHRLKVSNAFHSSFMNDASNKILSSRILPDIFKTVDVDVYSSTGKKAIEDKINLREYFSKQIISPVNFIAIVETISKNCDLLIEVGPGRVLTDLAKAINKGQSPICLPIESIAQNDRDLNIVLAEVFVRNVPIKWEELYKNRLIKIFVPASRKKFIENQCEHPLKIGNQIIKNESLSIPSNTFNEFEQKEEVIPGGLQGAVKGKDNIADLLVDLTHEITGFDRESITMNSKLLDDLNLDSIKAGEVIGKAARTLGIAGQLDPSRLSNNTLGEIRDRLNELALEAKTGSKEESVNDILKRYHDKTWVRNFVLDLKPEEIRTKNVNQLKELKHIVLLSEQDESLVDTIAKEFKNTKTKTQKLYYGNKVEKTGQIDCLITVLPRIKQASDFDKDSLKEIIRKSHRIVDLACSNQMNKDAFVIFVQFGGGNFGENKNLKDISSSCAKSLASTLYLERPDLKVRIIDFAEQVSDKEISSRIIDELQTYERFNTVGYDLKLTRKVVYYENSQPISYKKRNISWSAKDVVLVTGGAKGITAQCALEFARSTNARMVLMGRSIFPKEKGSDNNEIVQTLQQFEKEHLQATYFQCDVTNEQNVISVVKEIEHKLGKITGFIHGAGLNSLKRLKQVGINEALDESLPKVMGAVNVCKALSNSPPKLIIGITSIIGVTGMEGSGWYGLSNEVLNLYLHQFKNKYPKTEIATVAYSVWDEVGMGAKLGSVDRLADKGIGAIPVNEGVKRFRQLVEGDPGIQQVIVAARLAGLDTWKSLALKKNNFRFIENVEYVLPGVELIAHAHLNVKDDSYLLDHNWKGSLLFPFVFGFEAMSQAVGFVLGEDKFDQIIARNINLERPISVPRDTGTTIEIHAVVLEQTKNESSQIKVEIYSQETAYKEPHFSAIFDILTKPISKVKSDLSKKSTDTIDFDINADIYGPILFQGKIFQCIQDIHELSYNKETHKGECIFTSIKNKSTESFLKNNKKFHNSFLIGDPFFIDSILQSMQLIIPQDISLPRDIEEITLIPTNEKTEQEIKAQAEIKKIDTDHYRGDAQAIKEKFLLKIRNCRLKILDTVVDNPTANDLVNPIERDRAILDNVTRKYSREFGIKLPYFTATHIPGIHSKNKEERHKVELPFIEESVRGFLKKNNLIPNNLKIIWQSNGSPHVSSNLKHPAFLSLSHDRSLVLCAVGAEKQAIDLQSILVRPYEEWQTILGNKKFELIKDFKEGQLNYFGTAIWASSEVCIKSGFDSIQNFEIEKYENGKFIILRHGNDLLINIIIQFSRGSERLLSFLVKNHKSISEITLNDQLGFGKEYFHFNAEYSGPQQQLVTIKKFPVTFKNSKLKSRRVFFTSYSDWIGEIREYSLLPILKQLADIVETKEWGIATNNVVLDIKGELKGGDIVEARLWLGKRITDNVFDLEFEFRKNQDGNTERVATAVQRVSWVKILGHGVARVNRLPVFLEDIMQKMSPRTEQVKPLESLNEFYPQNKISLEQEIKSFADKKFYLKDFKLQTTLEESNLVGNVYFANYSIWIGRVTDFYFYGLWPELYLHDDINNEFVCTRLKIDHLNEAMPFDTICIRMYLSKIYANGLVLKYEVFANDSRRLAIATQSLIWIKRDKFFNPVADLIPQNLINKILGHNGRI